MSMKYFLLYFLTLMFTSVNVSMASTPNNISIIERDRKGELIFIYEYYGFYDAKIQQMNKRSYLEIISTIKGSLNVRENSPFFTHLTWFANEKILVALSTITTNNNPQIVLYDHLGEELGRMAVICKGGYTQSGAKCYQHKKNIYWFEKENDPELSIKLDRHNKSDISICLGEYCYNFTK